MSRISIGVVTCLMSVIQLVGCSEKAAKEAPAASSQQPGALNNGALCSQLSQNNYLMQSFGVLLQDLCGNNGQKLERLRNQYVYRGVSAPQVIIEAEESTITFQDNIKRSNMKAFAAMITPASPQSYFELLTMKIDQPQQFGQLYPQDTIDQNVEYTKLNGSPSNGVTYRYLNNNGAESQINYEAVARFIVISPNQLYVVASDFVQKLETVDSADGLSIINLNESGITEVISASEQTFENYNNHSAAISDAQKSFQNDLRFSYLQAKFKTENLGN